MEDFFKNNSNDSFDMNFLDSSSNRRYNEFSLEDNLKSTLVGGYSKGSVDSYISNIKNTVEQMRENFEFQLKEMVSEKELLSQENNLLKSQFTDAEQELNGLKEKYFEVEIEKDELVKEIEVEKENLDSEKTQVYVKYKEMEDVYKELIEEYEATRETLNLKCKTEEELNEKLIKLDLDNKEKIEEYNAARKVLEEFDSEVREKNAKLLELESMVDSKNEELNNIKEIVKEKDSIVEKIETEVKTQDEKIEELKNLVESKDIKLLELKDIENVLEAKNNEISKLTDKLENIGSQDSELLIEIENLKNELSLKEEQEKEKNRVIKTLELRASEVPAVNEQEIRDYKNKIQDLEHRIADAEAKKVGVEIEKNEKIESLLKENYHLQESLEDIKVKIGALQSENEVLSNQSRTFEDLRMKFDQLYNQFKEIQEENQELIIDKDILKDQIEKMQIDERELRILKKSSIAYKQKMDSQEADINDMIAQMEKQGATFQDIMIRYEKDQGKIRKLIQEKTDLQTRNIDLLEELRQLNKIIISKESDEKQNVREATRLEDVKKKDDVITMFNK